MHHIAAYLNWKLFEGRASAGNIRWKIRVGKIFTQNTSSVHFGWKKCCFWFSNCNYNVCIFSYYVAHCVSSHFTIWVKKQFFGVSNMTKRKKNCSNRAWSLIGYIKLLWYKIAPPGFVFWIRNKKIIDLTYRMFWRQGWYKKRIESIPF